VRGAGRGVVGGACGQRPREVGKGARGAAREAGSHTRELQQLSPPPPSPQSPPQPPKRSVFGEDALVNVSVEKTAEGRLAGYIRIRSKTQGIALSLG
jgi:hypothetical protein